jgi:hypothetical protein
MAKWDNSLPRTGWRNVNTIDLGEDASIIYSKSRRKEFFIKCQICKREIRFVHVMEHPEYVGQKHVGCVCAGRMEGDKNTPLAREKELINRHTCKMNFPGLDWKESKKGNPYLIYHGELVTIIKNSRSVYSIAYKGKFYDEFNGKKITNRTDAKFAAFDIIN